MSVGSALVAGNDAVPELAAAAAGIALAKIGGCPARGALLFLSAEFIAQAQAAVTAVARTLRCTEVAGGVAAGVFSDQGWVLDRPAAALMVFAGDLALRPHRPAAGASAGAGAGTILIYGGSDLPRAGSDGGGARCGGCFAGRPGKSEAIAWQQSRLAQQCAVEVHGARVDVAVSRGWRPLGRPAVVSGSRGLDVLEVQGEPALAHLQRSLPAQLQAGGRLPLPSLCAVLLDDPGMDCDGAGQQAFSEGRLHPVAVIAANADGSLTLARPVVAGSPLQWAIRMPEASAADMRRSLSALLPLAPQPLAAVAFSCIGRGPYHYGGRDEDLACLHELLPDLPLIGAYGTGQIAPLPHAGNRLLQNAVVTALISRPERRSDVQSDT
jgi:small ligand-binding sensory domain FIST